MQAQNRSAQSFEEFGMLGDISRVDHIYLACGYTDLRRGIDGLAQIVQQQFELDLNRSVKSRQWKKASPCRIIEPHEEVLLCPENTQK